MANKTFNIRLCQKYDTYDKYVENNPLLLAGEMAIVTVGEKVTNSKGDIVQFPVTMAKIGNGTDLFNDLPWLSALASNVSDWALAESKPVYDASEIQNLSNFISDAVEDTNTKYRLFTEDDMTYKLQSTNASTPTENDWADVVGSTFTKTTVTVGTTDGTISVNGTDVQIKGFSALSTQVVDNKEAIATLNGDATTEGSVAKAVSDAKTELTEAMDNKISSAIASTYKPAGSTTFADLTAEGMLDATNVGKVYNVTDAFTTTDSFIEGAGKNYPVGTNVVIINAGTEEAPEYKFDVLQGFVDLSNYSTTTEMNSAIEDAIGNLTPDQIPTLPSSKIENFNTEVTNVINTELNKEPAEGEGPSALQQTIINEAGKVADEKIAELNNSDGAVDGQYVIEVSQKDGLVNVKRGQVDIAHLVQLTSDTIVLQCGDATTV